MTEYHRIRFKAAGAKRRSSRWAVRQPSKRPGIEVWRFCNREGDFGSGTDRRGNWVDKVDLLLAGAGTVEATPAWFCWKYGDLTTAPACDLPDCPCNTESDS